MRSKAKWITNKYIGIMLLVFPLWTGFDGYSSITLSKLLFFAVATGLWLLCLALCLMADRRLPRFGMAAWAAVFFMGAAGLSALCSPYREYVLLGASRYDGLMTMLLYGGIFLGVSLFGRRRRIYIWLLAVSASLCSLVALLQLYGLDPLRLFPTGLDYYDAGVKYSGAFLGTVGNVDVLAALYALCIPTFVCAGLLGRRRERLLLLPAGLCLYVLIRSGVASGPVALLGCGLVAVPAVIFCRRGRRLGLAAAALSASICAAGLAAVYFLPLEKGTLFELSELLHGRVDPSFGSHRVEIWGECLRLVSQRPILGGGPDTLTLRTELGYSRYVAETGRTLSVHIDNAHNEFLNYLVNLGALGLSGYVAMAGISLGRALSDGDGIPAALGCGLLCYLMQSFFGLGLCLTTPLVYVFMGLLCAPAEETYGK